MTPYCLIVPKTHGQVLARSGEEQVMPQMVSYPVSQSVTEQTTTSSEITLCFNKVRLCVKKQMSTQMNMVPTRKPETRSIEFFVGYSAHNLSRYPGVYREMGKVAISAPPWKQMSMQLCVCPSGCLSLPHTIWTYMHPAWGLKPFRRDPRKSNLH